MIQRKCPCSWCGVPHSHPTIKIIWCKLMFWATTCLSPWNVNKNLPHNKSWDKIKQTQYLLAKKKAEFSNPSPLPCVSLFFSFWCLAALNLPMQWFISLSSVRMQPDFWDTLNIGSNILVSDTSLVRIPSINSYVFMTVIFYWNIFELLKSLPSLSVLLRNSFVFSSNFKWDPLRIKSTS